MRLPYFGIAGCRGPLLSATSLSLSLSLFTFHPCPRSRADLAVSRSHSGRVEIPRAYAMRLSTVPNAHASPLRGLDWQHSRVRRKESPALVSSLDPLQRAISGPLLLSSPPSNPQLLPGRWSVLLSATTGTGVQLISEDLGAAAQLTFPMSIWR